MLTTRKHPNRYRQPFVATAPLRRPGAVGVDSSTSESLLDGSQASIATAEHPLCQVAENERLYQFENSVKRAFAKIDPAVDEIMNLPTDGQFQQQARALCNEMLGLELPVDLLSAAASRSINRSKLFAWCVFATYQGFCTQFFGENPLAAEADENFQSFIQYCGFHSVDISPCADGRLAHVIRYVLRFPQSDVRRKSFAGAMFDIDDSVQKWVEVEMLRHREATPNAADEPTRYLKMVAYHYSSVDPGCEGCAAHGSDTGKAASAGLDQLNGFREAIENSFCCGASIDLLLVGIDTDTDSMRIHIPDGEGDLSIDRFIDTLDIFRKTQQQNATEARRTLNADVRNCAPDVNEGMSQFINQIIENNLSQIAYVRQYFGSAYPDTGHAEHFIGCGVGFEEIQLRNLMYFAYLNTVEEGAADLDVGIKIFSGLNLSRDLPVPVVVRFDYHGHVPGARDRAITRCRRIGEALKARYSELMQNSMLHILQVIRDCGSNEGLEVLHCSINEELTVGVH